TAVLPAFLAAIGAGPGWLGAIEGIADGLSSFTKLGAGYYTDRLKHRKPLAVFGYAFTALSTASFAFATHAYHVLFGRAAAWLARGGCFAVGLRTRLRAGAADGYDRRDRRAADRALAARSYASQLSHGLLVDAPSGHDRGGQLLASRSRASHRSHEKTDLPHRAAGLAGNIPPFSIRRRRLRRGRFFAHALDTLRHPPARSRTRYGPRSQPRGRTLHAT